jgi:hypothetical protein
MSGVLARSVRPEPRDQEIAIDAVAPGPILMGPPHRRARHTVASLLRLAAGEHHGVQMSPTLRTILSIVIISLGGVMVGRTLSHAVQQRMTRTAMLAGLLTGVAAVGIGTTFRMSRVTHPGAQWIELACIVLFAAGILMETRERSRLAR